MAPGEKKQVDLDGLEVALFNVDGEYYVIEDVCTHDGAPLAHGKFTGKEINCPRHGARFDVCTGTALCMPAIERWTPMRSKSTVTTSVSRSICRRPRGNFLPA